MASQTNSLFCLGIDSQGWQAARQGRAQHGITASSFVAMWVSDWADNNSPIWSVSLGRDTQPLSDHLLLELLRSHYKVLYIFKKNSFEGCSVR